MSETQCKRCGELPDNCECSPTDLHIRRLNDTLAARDAEIAGLRKERDKAVRELTERGFEDRGGERWVPPLGKKPDFDLIDNLRSELAEAREVVREYSKTDCEHSQAIYCYACKVARDTCAAAWLAKEEANG